MDTLLKRMVAFTRPQMAFLQARAKKLGVSVSEVIRRIIDDFREE